MAAAGSPARAMPWTSRRPSSTSQLGAAAQARATRPEAVSERRMSRVRPSTSDTGPVTSSAAPSPAVVSDSDSVLCPADSENARASTGSRAWVLYSSANVATPAANSATAILRYPGSPAR